MDLRNRDVVRAYEPYRKEALYCLVVDVLIILGCAAMVITTGVRDRGILSLFGGFFVLFFVIEIFTDFRLGLLSRIEESCQLYVQLVIQVVQIKEEHSTSGHWGSIIPKLYPKNLNVQRYKISCFDSNMKKLRLRSAMGEKNAQALYDIVTKNNSMKYTVLIGKYTHIIVKYCDKDDISLKLNRTL